MRIVAVAAAMCLGIVSFACAQPSTASVTQSIDVKASDLNSALTVFSGESGVHVVYISEDVGARRSPGAVGVLTPAEALQQILRGTGLTYRFLDPHTVTILPQDADGSAKDHDQRSEATPKRQEEDKNPGSTSFRVAQLDQGPAPTAASMISAPTRLQRLPLGDCGYCLASRRALESSRECRLRHLRR